MMKMMINQSLITLIVWLAAGAVVVAKTALPGDDLQAILNKGNDLALAKGAVYEISQTLRYTTSGQKIYTKDAKYPSDYATLRLASTKLMLLINAGGVEEAVLERVICDGNRYNLSVVPKPRIGGGGQPPLVNFGGKGGDGQIVRQCVFMNSRTWATLKMHEGASKLLTDDNHLDDKAAYTLASLCILGLALRWSDDDKN